MNTLYRKTIMCICLLIICNNYLFPQQAYKTIVKLTDLNNEVQLNKMQSNATELLTEMNTAYFENREPNIRPNIITEEARENLSLIWETSPLRCTETQIIERVLQMKREAKYQVRNIPVFIKAVSSEVENKTVKESNENHDYEICLVFDNHGRIEDIFYSIETTHYMRLMNEGPSTTEEISRREFILEFIENLRTAYNRKDIPFLEKVYSNDALIITGKIIEVEHSDMMNQLGESTVIYQVQTKEEYINSLKKRIFKINKYVNITFDSIKIVRDKKYIDIYGVTLKQHWNTPGYKDVGYLFLMIDFKDENKPMILVRTWQPEGAERTKKGIYGLNSFEIIR
ncbi:MAG: hypothetical protein C0412_13970 [Flavobacterium sp.]|nr:hypothetical protein [Flavobacterium sp.]